MKINCNAGYDSSCTAIRDFPGKLFPAGGMHLSRLGCRHFTL